MIPIDPDDDLRACFGDLRERESERVPSVASIMRRSRSVAPRPWVHLRSVAVTAALVVTATVAIGLWHRGEVESNRVLAAWQRLELDRWASPTHALLDPPQSEILSGLPSLGWDARWPLASPATDHESRSPR